MSWFSRSPTNVPHPVAVAVVCIIRRDSVAAARVRVAVFEGVAPVGVSKGWDPSGNDWTMSLDQPIP
ncbi:MAG: hypothetical protein AAGF75_11520 [Cyanobacteria bacterium P01_H01_bin.130]